MPDFELKKYNLLAFYSTLFHTRSGCLTTDRHAAADVRSSDVVKFRKRHLQLSLFFAFFFLSLYC